MNEENNVVNAENTAPQETTVNKETPISINQDVKKETLQQDIAQDETPEAPESTQQPVQNVTKDRDNSEEKKPEISESIELDVKNEILEQAITQEEEPDASFDATSLSKLSLADLLKESETVLVLTPKAASTKLKAIRSVFFEKFNAKKDAALEEYNASKTDESPEFSFDQSSLADALAEVGEKVKAAREEEKERINSEKKKNLARKEELLSKLEQLVEQDETLESINEVKVIQKEWKTIRVLPKEAV